MFEFISGIAGFVEWFWAILDDLRRKEAGVVSSLGLKFVLHSYSFPGLLVRVIDLLHDFCLSERLPNYSIFCDGAEFFCPWAFSDYFRLPYLEIRCRWAGCLSSLFELNGFEVLLYPRPISNWFLFLEAWISELDLYRSG